MLAFTLRVFAALVEERRQAFDHGGFPLGKQIRVELMLAGDLSDAPLAAQDLLHDLGFEGGGKRSSLHCFPL